MKVQVEKVIYNSGNDPIVVDIQYGKLTESFVSNANVDVFKDCSGKRAKTVVAAHSDKVVFVGEVTPDKSCYNDFLLIRNKKTNKVRLVHYDTVNLDKYSKSDINILEKTTSEKKTRAEVTKEFGSRRAVRVTELREKLQFNIENTKENLLKAVEEVETDEGLLNNSQTQSVATSVDYLPPINRDASSVNEVYELNNLIPSHIMDGLQTDVNTVLECEDLSQLPLCQFCMNNIRILKGNDEIDSDDPRCKIYLYLNYLIKFLVTPVRSMNRKFSICQSSTVVNFYILDNFSGSSKALRTRSASMKDKLICNILVLAMIASSKKILDLEVLSQDLKLGMKKLQEVSRMLAFSPNGSKHVVLKLPLPAAATLTKKKKK